MGAIRRIAFALFAAACVAAQTPTGAFVGTVTETNHSDQISVKPDKGDAVSVRLTADTVLQRIAPGEKNLKNAQAVEASQIAKGDRVLVNLMPDGPVARRVVVMSSNDIEARKEADRLDWTKRGVAGLVSSKTASEIHLQSRSFAGQQTINVVVNDKTVYRRYAPDSVNFADAKVSSVAEVSQGDQLRARGTKSPDGLTVTADEVVFGTFVTKGGTVTAVDAAAKEITVQDLATKKPLIIKIVADTRMKKFPDFSKMFGGAPGFGGPGAAAGSGPAGSKAPAAPAGMGMRPVGAGPATPGSGPGGGMPGAGFRPPDFAQMLERMPPATLDDVKPGQVIVVSSTKGAQQDHITAIMLLANADFLVQMAAMQSQRSGMPASGGMPMGGMSPGIGGMQMPGASGGLELPGMMP